MRKESNAEVRNEANYPFAFCPSCGKPGPQFENNHRLCCEACGLEYFQNVAAAVGAFLLIGEGKKERLVLLVRARDPQAGKLSLPGGFIDAGEGALDALWRECKEEIGLESVGKPSFLASFPNRYEYTGITYHTCDFFFVIHAPNLREEELSLDLDESQSMRFCIPDKVEASELAFDSIRKAYQVFLEGRTNT